MVSRVHRYPIVGDKPLPVSDHPVKLLFLGTCAITPLLTGLRNQGFEANHILWESLTYSQVPEFDHGKYDALVVSITLRHILSDAVQLLEPGATSSNSIYWPRALQSGQIEAYLQACTAMLDNKVAEIFAAGFQGEIFFLSFLEPKHNYLGNLLPRYSLSNPVQFIRKLNEALERSIASRSSAHLFDMNELMNLVGRARIQDDYVASLSHASLLGDDTWDRDRIQPSTQPRAMYETFEALVEFEQVLARRLLDDLAIIRQPLAIKAIIVDLDDTLWRGIAAEELDKPFWEFAEGWPLGMVEALLVFKARGGMIAVCSKNDRNVIEDRMRHIFNGQIRFEDFASVRVNFERKSDNVRDILADMNILPGNAMFIDDNPREIDEVRSVFPEMIFLSAEHYDWRRKILMSPATQVPAISGEARLRTESVRANVAREAARATMSHDEWLTSLGLREEIAIVRSSEDPSFDRALELLNKTNQFNTTGRRWTRAEIEALLADGAVLLCARLRDRLADNGMIGVTIVKGPDIVQSVLSCRAFKFGAEMASGSVACGLILRQFPHVSARIVDTGLNASCHPYFRLMGFVEQEPGLWQTHTRPALPPHIELSVV